MGKPRNRQRARISELAPSPPPVIPETVLTAWSAAEASNPPGCSATLPVGAAIGQVCIAVINFNEVSALYLSTWAITSSTGWTDCGFQRGAAQISGVVFSKALDATDIANGYITGGCTSNAFVPGAIYIFVLPNRTIPPTATSDMFTNATTLTIETVTPTTVGTLILAVPVTYVSSAPNIFANPLVHALPNRLPGGFERGGYTPGYHTQDGTITTVTFTPVTSGAAYAVGFVVVIPNNAPTYIGQSTATYWANRGTASTISAPSHSGGDLLILHSVSDATTGTLDAPVGWTLLKSDTLGTVRSKLYYRVADGTSSDSPLMTPAGGNAYGGVIIAVYRYAQISGSAVSTTGSGVGTFLGPSITATEDYQLGLTFASRGNGTGANWDAANKGTERWDVSGNWMCSQLVEVAGNTGAEIAAVLTNYAAGSSTKVIQSVALKRIS